MEKLRRSLGEHLKPIKLYLDDIEHVFEIFKEAGDNIKVEADNYKLSSIDEIASINKPYFTDFSISQEDIGVSITCSKNSVWLYAHHDSPVQRGLFEKTKSLLKTKYRPFIWLYHSSASGAFTGLSSWAFFSIMFGDTKNWFYITVGIFMLFIGLLWTILGHKSVTSQ